MRVSVLSAVILVAVGAACSGTIRTAPPSPRGQGGGGVGNSVRTLGVPPGQLPRVGQCRVWVPGVPPGRQARSRSCDGILATAPAGSMVLYRPSRDRSLVRVRYIHASRVGVIISVRLFNASSLEFVRDDEVNDEDRDRGEDRDERRGRGRGRP